MDKIKIKCTKSYGWAEKDEIYEVNNYIAYNWGEKPHFEVGKGYKGIALAHCEVLPMPTQKPETVVEFLQANDLSEKALIEWLIDNYINEDLL